MNADDVPSRFSVDFADAELLGIYRVEKKLADGGMGSVWLGEDTNLGRRVVVKVPHVRFLGETGFRARFKREIAELVRLEHPNIVRILAQGTHEEIPFFVLQYLGGGSLEDRLRQAGPEPRGVDAITPWLRTIAATLDFVHSRGVVHRDVKPENILFDEGDHVFLSDFGVVKALDEDLGVTEAGTGVGSPKYMAPEQGLGRAVGGAADQYGLATAVYEVISGRLPFEGGTALEVMLNKQKEDPTPLSDLAPDLPTECAHTVMRGLAADPANRFPSCEDFADAFLAGAGIHDRTPAAGVPVVERAAGGGRRLAAVAMTLVLLAAAGLAIAFAAGAFEPTVVAPPAEEGPKDPFEVVLLDPGSEPRQVLRYRPEVGSKEKTVTTTEQEQSLQFGSKDPTPVTIPQIVAEVTYTVKERTDAEIAYEWEYDGLRAEATEGSMPADVEMIRAAIEKLEGIRGKGSESVRGIGRDFTFDAVEDANPMVASLLTLITTAVKQIGQPLPAEPVGVGARWETTQVVDSMGMRFTQTATHRIESIHGNQVRVSIRVAITAPAQDFHAPTMPEGGDLELSSLHGEGRGSAVIDLDHLAPRRSAVEVEMSIKLRRSKGGGEAEGEEAHALTISSKSKTETNRE